MYKWILILLLILPSAFAAPAVVDVFAQYNGNTYSELYENDTVVVRINDSADGATACFISNVSDCSVNASMILTGEYFEKVYYNITPGDKTQYYYCKDAVGLTETCTVQIPYTVSSKFNILVSAFFIVPP